MPAKPQGVYEDGRGRWYFKVTLGHDALTGKRVQITRRGFRKPLADAWGGPVANPGHQPEDRFARTMVA